MHTAIYREYLLPQGEGHDGMDAGGRAMHGAIAEDEGGLALSALTPARREREKILRTIYWSDQ